MVVLTHVVIIASISHKKQAEAFPHDISPGN